MADDLPDAPWITGGGGTDLPDAPWATGHQYGTGESAMEGYLKGASANWRDEVYGASKASGLPDWMGGFRAPVGAARLAYEHLTQPKSITGLVTGDMRGPVQKQYEQARDEKRRTEEAMQQQHPYAFGAGELGGAAASVLAAPEMAPAKMLASPLGRVGASMASGAGYGAISGAGEAERPQDILSEAGKGAAAGTLLGGAGIVATEVAAPIVQKGMNIVRGLRNPEDEALRRIALAAEADAAKGGELMTPQDIKLARDRGIPLGTIDVGGETMRALGEDAATTSPAGRAALEGLIKPRFETQAPRSAEYIREITQGADAAADSEALQAAAKKANRPAYKAAYQAGAGGLWTPELERLASSPAVRSAMQAAVQRGRDRAVAEGMGAFNPGVTFENGIMKFGQGKGAPPYPDAQYWDYVQRELRDAQNAARRSGRNEEAGALGGLHRSLLAELDNANPAFKAARQSAAGFFGAESALEAGQNFVKSGADIAGARQALKRMNPAEKELFARGYASDLADSIERGGDNRNILLNQAFNSVAGRQRTQLALGPGRAQQLEAYLRIERLLDRARPILGGSQTARRLAQMGMAGGFGAGDYLLEGSVNPLHMGAAAFAGALLHRGTEHINQGVVAQVGKLLASDKVQDIARGVKIAARDASIMKRLRQLTSGAITGTGTEAAAELLHQKPGQGFKHGGKIHREKVGQRQAQALGRADGGGTDSDDINLSPDAQALSSTMTHYAEQPNPAAPYLQAARDFASGGLQRAFNLPNNAVGRALQSDAANTALGAMGEFPTVRGAGSVIGYRTELLDRSGRKLTVAPDEEHLLDSLRSWNGDLNRTLDGYRESYVNYPRAERRDDIVTLEKWKRLGVKLGIANPANERARGGGVVAAHKQSRVGLAQNPSGVPFRCSTCMFIKKGVCQNPDSLLHEKKVKPDWCCKEYDRPDMKVIA